MTAIPHNRPQITDEDRAAVDAVLRSGWIAEGPQVRALETRFDRLYGGGGSCAVSSGTAALYLALRALGIEKGDAIAVPTYACSALLNAVYMAEASPIVVDVCADDFNMDPAAISALDGRVRAAIVVHSFGSPADIAAIAGSCPIVIEDCCHSLGGTVNRRPVGSIANAAVFSFYATKIVTAGQGGLLHGAIDVAERARDFREFDQRPSYAPRFNFQMTDFQAAMVNSQLGRIDAIAARRRAIAQRYIEVLPAEIDVQAGVDDGERMVYRFVVKFRDAGRRDAARRTLSAQGIQTIVPMERYELLHRYLRLDPARFPVAEQLADTTLSLPLFPSLSDREVDRVCDAIGRLSVA